MMPPQMRDNLRRIASLALCLAACSTTGPEGASGEPPGTSGALTSGSTGTTGAGVTGDETGVTTEVITGGTTGGDSTDYEQPGANPAGNLTFTVDLTGRALRVEVWYPAALSAAAAADAGESIVEFVPPGPDRDALMGLLAMPSPAGAVGVTPQTHAARDAVPADMSPRPLVLFSHCHSCTRFSVFTIAEHLASRGFIVAAPDHAGNTLFDQLAGDSAEVGEEFLKVRVADLGGLLDALLDPEHPDVPAAIRGTVDPLKVGVMGHSFGAGAAGRLAQEDDRIVAALPIFAPVENPLFPGTKVAQIAEPTLFALAVEDNSIGKLGNTLLESNFEAAAEPTRLLRIHDTGHWGMTDICGLVPGFDPGCGPGTRMTDGTAFTYREPASVRAIVRAYAAAFFDLHLQGNPAAGVYLDAAQPENGVEVTSRL